MGGWRRGRKRERERERWWRDSCHSRHFIGVYIYFHVRIDRNVDEVQTNVEAAHTELLKYFKGITSNRWLMIKIFAVVIVFFIIFIVFLT